MKLLLTLVLITLTHKTWAMITPMTNYTPTVVNSIEDANRMFRYLVNGNKWNNECYNKAHIWAKQMDDNDNIKSMKKFIFYTKKFRRSLPKSKWWFHVAPMINVNGENYIMDLAYARQPILAEDWEKMLIDKLERNGIKDYRCKVITKISEFHNKQNHETEYCNVLIANMYYWVPGDIEDLENEGIEKDQWNNGELFTAAKNVFWRYGRIYRQIKIK